ncbi:MAG: tetratricopeptide repeat protein [Candidatus Eiseniibacteriota bacterium]
MRALCNAIVLSVLVLAAAGPFLANPPVAGAQSTPAAQVAKVAGDSLYARFDFEGSLKQYQAGLAADSASYDLWWRTARSLVDRGARAEYDKRKPDAQTAFTQAVRAARKATALSPDGWEGHEMLALSLGRLALFQGGKEKIRISKEVKAEVDRSIGLNPNADRSYHILARWNRGITTLSFFEKAAAKVVYGGVPKGATLENAVTYLEKAVEINPRNANHHLELGKTYLELDLNAKAREQFEKALACPQTSPFDKEYKEEAQSLLSKMKS